MVAKSKSLEYVPDANPQEVPDDWDFETVRDSTPTRVIFEEIGETFIGQYVGKELITPDNIDPFSMHVFKARDGERYAMSDSFALNDYFEDNADDAIGKWFRLTYVQDIPSKKGNPMKDIRIDVRK